MDSDGSLVDGDGEESAWSEVDADESLDEKSDTDDSVLVLSPKTAPQLALEPEAVAFRAHAPPSDDSDSDASPPALTGVEQQPGIEREPAPGPELLFPSAAAERAAACAEDASCTRRSADNAPWWGASRRLELADDEDDGGGGIRSAAATRAKSTAAPARGRVRVALPRLLAALGLVPLRLLGRRPARPPGIVGHRARSPRTPGRRRNRWGLPRPSGS